MSVQTEARLAESYPNYQVYTYLIIQETNAITNVCVCSCLCYVSTSIPVVPVNISCTRTEFTIHISQQSLPGLERESIYLGDRSCTAQLTPTTYKILARFEKCGTAGQVTNYPLVDSNCFRFNSITLSQRGIDVELSCVPSG